MISRKWIKFLVLMVLGLIIVTCAAPRQKMTTSIKVEPLPSVAPVVMSQLPDWIEQISPTGDAAPLNQILIRFKEPVIPVESLESPQQQELLKRFEIMPQLPGEFKFLTPRMVGFQPAQALPKATRIQVTLKAGLADLKNHKLDQDFAWTFNTEPIKLSNLPTTYRKDEDPKFFDVKPTLKFNSNVELDLGSAKDLVKLVDEKNSNSVAVTVALEPTDSETPAENFDPSQRQWRYTLVPQQQLEKATKYRLKFESGLKPLGGNLPSQTPFTSEIETYSPLAFKGIKFFGQPDAGGTYGRFNQGVAQLQFNNNIVVETAAENITIQPPPKKTPKPVQIYEGQSFISLNPWSLEPDTTYTITIGKNLKDQFGQTLEKPVTVTYQTGDIAPDIWAPSGLNIFPSDQNLNLNISTVNLPNASYKATYKVLQPTDLVYYDSAYPQGEGNDLLPPPESWKSQKIADKKNQTLETTVPLKEQLKGTGGLLAYGVQGRTYQYQQEGKQLWRDPVYYGMVQLTNLGVFSQWFPESGFIRVHHLADGSPAEATVDVYLSKVNAKDRPQPQACATGKTDKNGVLLLTRESLKQCMGGQRFNNPPKLLVIAKESQDWAFARSEEYSGSYGYGIEAGWEEDKPLSRGALFSDRQLYQPGETVQLTGMAYYLSQGEIQQDKNAQYTILLKTPNGTDLELGTQKTNEFGTFSLEIPIKASYDLGTYIVTAKSDKAVEISGQFRVAEFKPPNFKVDLNLDQEFALIGDKIAAKTQSNYLFGLPVERGNVKYYVTRQKIEFTPKGWEKFTFGRQWFWPEEAPHVPTDVLQKNAALDNSGANSQSVTVAKDLPYPMQYRVDAEVKDVSNLAVANSQTFTALPTDRLIGLHSNFVADAGKPFSVEVIVTDPSGKPMAGEKVRLELQQIKYSSVTQVVEGGRNDRPQVEYKTVATTDIKSGDQAQTATLTPTEAGSYRIRANLANTNTEITATDIQIWASGAGEVSWGSRYDNNRLEVKLDKETYQPGETATALIQSPYPEGELYVAVIRDKPLYTTTVKAKGAAPQIQFTVTPDMVPNAAVEAVLIRQGAPLPQVEPGSLDNLMQVGFTPFKTSLENKYLKVDITPQQTQWQPQTDATINLNLKDSQGKPVKGQFTVMVVNEAVLQLTGYRPPDLVETVYAEQPISTRFSDNRPNVILQNLSSPLAKGWGYGGGFSPGSANTRVRTDFKPLAYYKASVITDANGKASVTFKLPDDLTTWRVMAVATDGNLHFGKGDATFLTTQPLISNPILPQFARPGDRMEAGVSVTNTGSDKGNLTIQGTVTKNLQFVNKSATADSLQTKAESGTHAYRFPLLAAATGSGKVQFVTQLNNQKADAFEVPLPVVPQVITETVVEAGTTENQAKIPLNVDKSVVKDTGGLSISLASTLIPEIIAPAKQVLDQEQLPFLEPAASQLAIAANLQILSKKYGQAFAEFNPSEQAKTALEQLQKLQQPDGGFTSWPGSQQSDPFVTPLAAEAIANAAKVFPDVVDDGMVSRLKTYLKETRSKPSQYEFCKDKTCQNRLRLSAGIALAQLGEKSNEFLADIYAQRNELDTVAQVKLARYLSEFPDWQQQGKTLANELLESVTQTGRSATVNLPRGWSWLSSPATVQAQMLQLMIAQKSQPEVIDRLLQGLLNQRRQGTWQSTFDNAQALSALVSYSETQPVPPQFAATVKLGGKNLESVKFSGYQNPNQFINVAMDQVPRGQSEIVLDKSGNGTLHYLVEYSYRLPGNQPGRFNGLRVVRQIRPVFGEEDTVLQRIGLSVPEKPLTVKAGQVFDIGLEIISDHPVDHVVITDPLPAGFEAVDSSFQTSAPSVQAQASNWQIGYHTIHRDRIEASGDQLEAGIYTLHYLVRSVTPGTFEWPGSEVHLQYAPEEFGRAAASTLEVKE